MKNKHSDRKTAFTRFELAVVVATVAMLLALISVALPRGKEKARREQCFRNLREIGLAFRQWPQYSIDEYPMSVPENLGGVQQSVTRGEVFRAFQALSNELSTPKVFVCPSDTRTPATEFATLLSNTNVGYFVSLDASESYPQTFLAGDRNLEIDGMAAIPGIVNLQSNDVVGWTREMHNRFGNVALADGLVQGFRKLRFSLPVQETGVATNRLVIP